MGTDPETSEDASFVPVFSSAGLLGLADVAFVRGVLEAGGIPVLSRGSGYAGAGIPVEVLVPQDRIEEARRLLADAEAAGPSSADDAESASEGVLSAGLRYPQDMGNTPDDSEDFDLVTVFSSDEHNAEMQAQAVQSVLEAGGIPCMIMGTEMIPALPIEVRVPKARLAEAQALLAESEAAGPKAAEEAERASEEEPR